MRIPARLNAPLALVVVLSACTEPSSKTATGPSGPDVVSVTIDGPATLPPGQTAQFTATLRLSDGTTKIAVAPNVSWSSSNQSVLSVSTAGVATARGSNGEAVVSAVVTRLTPNSARNASREVIVTQDGTFRVVGMVTDAEFPTVPVVGARVQLTPSTVFSLTDSTGRYKLYNVPPSANIQVSADGYTTATQTFQFAANSTQNFLLALPGPRPNLSGNYRLAVDVVSACASTPNLAANLQHRQYDATITQNGPTLDVTLTEPIFRVVGTRGNHFTGQVGASGAVFTLDPYFFYYYYYGPPSYPSVAERLGNNTYPVFDGRAVTTGSASGLSGQLSGAIQNWDSRFPNSAFVVGWCSPATMQFTLTPR